MSAQAKLPLDKPNPLYPGPLPAAGVDQRRAHAESKRREWAQPLKDKLKEKRNELV